MSRTSRTFPLSVIASVCQNRLLCPFEEYRDFLRHATGANVALWDVERARRVVANRLQTVFIDLRKLPTPPEKTDSGNAGKYVRECATVLGYDSLTIAPGRSKFAERTLSEALK